MAVVNKNNLNSLPLQSDLNPLYTLKKDKFEIEARSKIILFTNLSADDFPCICKKVSAF
jgi:hypothetical protein